MRPTIARLPPGQLAGQVLGRGRLAVVVLAAVVVRRVDHQPLGQVGRAQLGQRVADRLGR